MANFLDGRRQFIRMVVTGVAESNPRDIRCVGDLVAVKYSNYAEPRTHGGAVNVRTGSAAQRPRGVFERLPGQKRSCPCCDGLG